MTIYAVAGAFLLSLLPNFADAKIQRSSAAVREFRAANPCPATGALRGACEGWQVDHIIPLCAGGADLPHNMQWLTVSEHKEKTRIDVMQCRRRNIKPKESP